MCDDRNNRAIFRSRWGTARAALFTVMAWMVMGGWPFAQRSEGADPDPIQAPGDERALVSIFNGKDLTGWDGDPRFWSVRDGILRGETTLESAAEHNTFLILRGQEPGDFVLKLKFRIMADGNSGVQFRSRDRGDWEVAGYQAEIANDRPDPGIGTGFVLDEHGRGGKDAYGPRGDLGRVGEFVVIDAVGKRNVIARVADVKALQSVGYYKNGEWNDYTIVAQGNRIRTWVNGYQTLELIDNDPRKVSRGIVALQIHRGKPMLVEFKDLKLQVLDADVGPGGRKFNDRGQSGWVTGAD
jgi:Domain of Unknown Function (DUF1080)